MRLTRTSTRALRRSCPIRTRRPVWIEDAVDEFSLDEGSIYTPGETAPSAASSMARSAVIIGIAFMASRVLGLLREIILANRFGTSSDYDAYVSAFRIPDLLFGQSLLV